MPYHVLHHIMPSVSFHFAPSYPTLGSTPSAKPAATSVKYEQGLQMLQEMGFDTPLATRALDASSGDLEVAVELLSSGSIAASASNVPPRSSCNAGASSSSASRMQVGKIAPPPAWSEAALEGALCRLVDDVADATPALQLVSKLVANVQVLIRQILLARCVRCSTFATGATPAPSQLRSQEHLIAELAAWTHRSKLLTVMNAR